MIENNIKIAVGYVRCSTDEQGSTSIPQQKEELEKFARTNGYEIIKWVVDQGKSGTTFESRPGFMALKKEVENSPPFQYVLVYDESRWGRSIDPRDNNYYRRHFELNNVKVRMMHTCSRNETDLGSILTEIIESAEASEYSKKLSRAIRRGMLSQQQGKYSRGGTAPYGYKRVAIDINSGERRDIRNGARSIPKQEKVVWELGDPIEVLTVRRIFDMKVHGLGYVSIADRLNTENIPCPRRGRWRNKDNKWSGSTIEGILTNPVYVGERIYNRRSFSKFAAQERGIQIDQRKNRIKIDNNESDWCVIPDAHPPIISKDLFRIASQFQEKNMPHANQHIYRSTYLLTGLITCAKCGYRYQGYHHKRSNNKYYVDGGFINKGKTVCDWFSIRQNVLDGFVIDSVRKLLQYCNTPRHINKFQKEIIDNQLRALKSNPGLMDTSTANNNMIAEEIISFSEIFKSYFETASIQEKKDLLRIVVHHIIVYPDLRQVNCYIKQFPIVGISGNLTIGK